MTEENGFTKLGLEKIKCPECFTTTDARLWEECQLPCEDCGDHDGLRCPNCDEGYDSVWGFERLEEFNTLEKKQKRVDTYGCGIQGTLQLGKDTPMTDKIFKSAQYIIHRRSICPEQLLISTYSSEILVPSEEL